MSKTSLPSPLVVFDTSYLAHRAKWTEGHLSHNGQPTGVFFGVLNQVNRFRRLFPPNAILVFAWDSKESKRAVVYPKYKSDRKKERTAAELAQRQEFSQQLEKLQSWILEPIGLVNHIRCRGLEADDCIACLANWAKKQKHIGDVCIISSDNDLFQLLDRAVIFRPHKNRNYTADDLMEEFKLRPDQWAHATAIAGTHNAVSGVYGVGIKLAAAYLKGGRIGKTKTQAIQDSERIIRRNLQLIRLPYRNMNALPPNFDPKPFTVREEGIEELRERFGFESLKLEDWR